MSPRSPIESRLIFRSTDWCQGLAREQIHPVADRWMAWINGVKNDDSAIAGNPLEPEGKIVGKNRVVSDGPFAASKDTIGGYFLLKVGTKDKAVTVAKPSPRIAARPPHGSGYHCQRMAYRAGSRIERPTCARLNCLSTIDH